MACRTVLTVAFTAAMFAGMNFGQAALSDYLAGSFVDEVNGVVLPYRLYVPSTYDGTPMPLLMTLHGNGENGTDNVRQVGGYVETLLSRCKSQEYNAFLLAPQSLGGWNYPRGDSAVRLVEYIETQYNIDPERIYVTGYSLGGMGAWYVAYYRNDKFAASVPVAGGADTYMAPRLLDQPVWAFHGTLDATVSVETDRRIVNAIRAMGGKPLLTEYPNAGHGITGLVYGEKNMWDWMFAQRLKLPRRTYVAPVPELNYISQDLGNGWAGYTFFIDWAQEEATTYSVNLAFRTTGNATLKQTKAFGAVAVHGQTQAEQFEMMDPSYDKEMDSWAFSPFCDNQRVGQNPFDGTTFTGALEGPNSFAISLSSGTSTYTGIAPVAYIVSDGSIEWKGQVRLNADSFDTEGCTAAPGDFNGDGEVNQADYCVWADSYGWSGNPGENPADTNNDGVVDMADYTIWADHFGQGRPR